MKRTVLVAGGTGLVGRALIAALLKTGQKVRVLSTRKGVEVTGAETFYWNPQDFHMDGQALDGTDVIVNLAGATVSKKWTTDYKQQIFDSRTRTAETLHRALRKMETHTVKAYVSASGVNYYPNSLDGVFVETDEPGNGYLAQVCQHWELGADKFNDTARVVKLRIGAVLSREGGMLEKIEPLAKWGVNSPVGSGEQWLSWIHIDDLVQLIIHAITKDTVQGVYNAVSPEPVRNKVFTKQLGQAVKRPVFLPNVPGFVLKGMLGEMSTIVLEGQNCSSAKITQTGFTFSHKTLKDALSDLY